MATTIVTLNVSQTQAPTPSQYQRTGAVISQGGTTLAAGSTGLITQTSDFTALVSQAAAITSLAWEADVVTVTLPAAHGIPTGDSTQVTIAGAVPTGYNGTFTATSTGETTFTYPLATDPGSESTPGTWLNYSATELTGAFSTFFAQSAGIACYILELGAGGADSGVAALSAYEALNPSTFYCYLVPRSWAPAPTYVAFASLYESATAKKYFFTTPTLEDYDSFTELFKSVFMEIEAPTVNEASEFSTAAAFSRLLAYNPSPTNQVCPFGNGYQYGVTVYPITPTEKVQFKAANLNYVATGAEGGISNTIIQWGNTCDGRPFNYWYSVDWVQINLDLALANEVINGANNPVAPLYFDQFGINRLQNRAANVMTQAISYGLALGSVILTTLDGTTFATNVATGVYAGYVVVNAVPFVSYNVTNPSDYAEGIYSGLSVVYTPKRGFDNIIVNLNVSDFA